MAAAQRPAHPAPPGVRPASPRRRRLLLGGTLGIGGSGLLAGCAVPALRLDGPADAGVAPLRIDNAADELAWLNRIGFGIDSTALADVQRQGLRDHLAAQLHPPRNAPLPPAAQQRIDAWAELQRPMVDTVAALEQRRSAAQALPDETARQAGQRAYQQEMNVQARAAASRTMLRALYAPSALQEQMTWFWFNHFNIYQGKANLRAMVGDYEDRLRPLALGRFADLLVASATHAAMLRYLDNAQNAARRINENFARELMERHTLGAASGYSQQDVQELARVLTGLGVRFDRAPPPVLRPALQPLYRWHDGAEFHPARHDMDDKVLLGQRVAGRGWDEILEQLTRLARHPATARHVSTRLALYLASDQPEPALVDRMAAAFTASDGSIAHTLQAMFEAPRFAPTLGRKFKDPLHYLVSAAKLTLDGAAAPDPAPLLAGLDRMGQGLFKRQTPDGYPLIAAAWSGSGQMATRFEVAQALVARSGPAPAQPTAAQRAIEASASPRTRAALDAATSPRERQLLLLCAPEFQYR